MGKKIALGAGLSILAFLAFASWFAGEQQKKEERVWLILDDISSGNFEGGNLKASYQTVCVSVDDAYKSKYAADGTSAVGAQQEVVNMLIEEHRCTVTGTDARFDMTAEGMEHFQTPHGQIDLWPASGH